ncbi:hypothetical protein PV327_010648 [Microctonus hyperodae]|uniref:Uncharacterized protein n=1 Tax=Microctonus hyperodae TaxID=165561 RepID=A0AA39C7W2_MICHY|nr:hypothetical protein PV327_010648 [Microctonus hyperodae]
MNNNDDSSSSDSSIDDHFQLPDKINFNSPFFKTTNKQKSNINKKTNKITSKNHHCDEQELDVDDTDDDDDDDFIEEDNVSSATLLAEVMKNLEKLERSNTTLINNETNTPQSPLPSTSGQIYQHEIKNDSLSNEINDLLLQGETDLGSTSFQSFNDDDDDDNDYDNTQNNIVECNNQSNYSVPKEGVVITLPDNNLTFNRRKKRDVNLIEELRKKLNRRLRLNQIFVHKVGILCWLAHSFHLNKQINDPELMSIALSLIPQKSYPKSRVDLKYLEQFTKWFRTLIKLDLNRDNKKKMNKRNNNDSDSTIFITKKVLMKGLMNKKVDNYRELVLLYICAARAIGINSRLIVSFYPPNLKPNHNNLFQLQNLKNEDETKINKIYDGTKRKRKSSIVEDESKNIKKLKILNNCESKCVNNDELKPIDIISKNSKQALNIAANDSRKRATEIISSKYMKDKNTKKKFDHIVWKKILIDDENEIESPAQIGHMRLNIASHENSEEKRLVKHFKSLKSSGEFESEKKAENKINNTEYVRQLRSRNIMRKNSKKDFDKNIKSESPSGITNRNNKDDDDDNSDVDYSAKNKKNKKRETKKKFTEFKTNNNSLRNNSKSMHDETIDRRVLSSDEEIAPEDQKNILNDGYYYLWAEIYVESEENWICVNVPDDKIHCVSNIYKKLPTPVLYIIAFNSIGKIKDVTRRYCNNWLTVTRKQRVDEKWLNDTLSPWKEAQTPISIAEDESLLQREMEQPLPKSISECKGHPLYALARHLLKFEALYPPDCVPLGHLKNGEAIYSRHCVHTLRSRETWLKVARVVKPAQEPYKIVKAMPKYDKLSGKTIKDLPLELFGHWQTMAYVPPEAKNGKVPRNEYGNVDLFKKCMLPKGTVHIDLPGLFRVAKKLNIDCVAAVVGFNFGGRGAMPMTQGYVVCEEFEDILREAWEEEQAKVAARAKEKRDKRIWGNWRKLIRGLFIREKIIAKYSSQENEDDDDDNEKLTK